MANQTTNAMVHLKGRVIVQIRKISKRQEPLNPVNIKAVERIAYFT